MTDIIPRLPFSIHPHSKIKNYWENLNEGKFSTTKCSVCGSIHFPPRIMCPYCYANSLKWIELPLIGRIIAFTYVNAPPAGFAKPYYLVVVHIPKLEKPIPGIFIGTKSPSINQEVEISFQQIGEQAFVHFK